LGDPSAGGGTSFLGLAITLALSALAMIWLLFLATRRRPAPRPAPAAAAARVAIPAGPGLAPPPETLFGNPMSVTAAPTAIVPVIDPSEADIPRWRRPSVKAARFGGTVAGASSARGPARWFIGPPPADVQRYGIRYDAVALLSEPDEVRGLVLDELDSGDELELVGQIAAWLQVRTPNHRVGWVQRMTVEALVPWDAWRGMAAEQAVVETPSDTETVSQLDSLLAEIVARRRADAERAAAAEPIPSAASDPRSTEPSAAVDPTPSPTASRVPRQPRGGRRRTAGVPSEEPAG
jgi:SH3-like domain-containing protein